MTVGRFSRFLNEGLIKLPRRLQHAAGAFFKESALAYLAYRGLRWAGKNKDQRRYALAELRRAAAVLDAPFPTAPKIARAGRTRAASTLVPVGELAARYLDALARHKDYDHLTRRQIKKLLGDLEIKVTVAFGAHKSTTGGSGGSYNNGPGYPEPELVISVPNLRLRVDADRSFGDLNGALITRRIKAGLATIEHELTHGIQDLVLSKLHPDQVKGENNDGGTDKDRYFQSPVEFDPLVKTAIGDLRSKVEAARVSGDRAKTRALFDGWAARSEFLNSLKKVSLPKWKKAVKLIWTEYDRRYL